MGSSDDNGNGNGKGKGKERDKDIFVYDFEFDDADSFETSCKNLPNQRSILNRDFFRKMFPGRRKFTSIAAYSASKLAQIMFCSILQRKLPSEASVNVMCVSSGVVTTNVARDLSPIIQTAYRLIPYFLFTPAEGARSSLFAATDPQVLEYCNVLRADDWAVCPYFSGECQPSNVAVDAHNLEVATKVWEKTLECVGLPLNAVDKLVHGENVPCKFNITIADGKMFKRTGAVALSSRIVRCVGSVEGFALQKIDLEEVTKLFSRMLRSPRVQGAIRFRVSKNTFSTSGDRKQLSILQG